MTNTVKILLVFIFLFSFFSCETIYNYDLSISGIDNLPATKLCIEKYLPKSVDAHKLHAEKEIRIECLIFNEHEQEIIDSLLVDTIFLDNKYELKFTVLALDPYDKTKEIEIKKTYFLSSIQ